MALTTDEIFYKALTSDKELMQTVGGRIRSTCFEVPPTEKDNTPTPYIIVIFDGMTNETSTKDDLEGYYDTSTVSIEIVADSRREVGRIARMARQAVRNYFSDIAEGDKDCEDVPKEYQLSASGVAWDWTKPCYYQILTYQCLTINDTEYTNL